jgi:DNA modification methylase
MKLYDDGAVQLYQGDFWEVTKSFPDGTFGLILADPPYQRIYVHLYTDMAVAASRLLCVGGSLLTIIPHYNMPHIYNQISKYLKYRWTLCMWQQSGAHARMAMGIEILWKPVGWWVKGSWPSGRGFVVDAWDNPMPQKLSHPWEQSLRWAEFLISKFHFNDDTILDPMVGTGTTLVAAKKLGRRAIGIELNPEVAAQAATRLRALDD